MFIQLMNKKERYVEDELGCRANPYVETHYLDIESQVLYISQDKAKELYVSKDSMGTELKPNDMVLRIFLKGTETGDDELIVKGDEIAAYIDLKAADYFINFIG